MYHQAEDKSEYSLMHAFIPVLYQDQSYTKLTLLKMPPMVHCTFTIKSCLYYVLFDWNLKFDPFDPKPL